MCKLNLKKSTKKIVTAILALGILATPVTIYASSQIYTNSVYDPVAQKRVGASHRCDVYSNDVFVRTMTYDTCSVKEWINITGYRNGIPYDDSAIGYIGYTDVNGGVEDWATDYFGGSYSITSARVDFGICRAGNWAWKNGFNQSAN